MGARKSAQASRLLALLGAYSAEPAAQRVALGGGGLAGLLLLGRPIPGAVVDPKAVLREAVERRQLEGLAHSGR